MMLRTMIELSIAVSGIYMACQGIRMKKRDEIPKMLVGKEFSTARAKDPKGFIRAMYPYTLAAGILLFWAGLLGALGISARSPFVASSLSVAPVVLIMAYGALLIRAQRKYLFGTSEKDQIKNR